MSPTTFLPLSTRNWRTHCRPYSPRWSFPLAIVQCVVHAPLVLAAEVGDIRGITGGGKCDGAGCRPRGRRRGRCAV